mmetsp:Transcript_34379/g.77485  ORF Transcript_34379/g.77485 Transcript_34379/m.77485 type:complete len:339 (-) Transcript_34379:8-1024(-)
MAPPWLRLYGAGEGDNGSSETTNMRRFYTLATGGSLLILVLVLACVAIPHSHTMMRIGEGDAGSPELDSVISAALEVASHQLKPEQIGFFRDRQAAISEQEELNRKWERKSVEHLVRLIQKASDSDQKEEEADIHHSGTSEDEQIHDQKSVHDTQDRDRQSSVQSSAVKQSLAQSKSIDGHADVHADVHADGVVSSQFKEDLKLMAQKRAARQKREESFLKLREEKHAIKENRLELLANARKDYQEARKQVVEVKERLKDALAQRDEMTEAVRSHGFLSAKQALHQLSPIKEKVDALLQETMSARQKWIAAKQALKTAEAIEEAPISLKSSSVAATEV